MTEMYFLLQLENSGNEEKLDALIKIIFCGKINLMNIRLYRFLEILQILLLMIGNKIRL